MVLMLLTPIHASPAAVASSPDLNVSYTLLDGSAEVQALISDQDGDLTSVTFYASDENSSKVIWTEYQIVEGQRASLNFTWPLQSWWAGNGTDFVGPMLVVNTIGMPASEASYEVLSAPAVLMPYPGSQDRTTLTYFDQDGVFHSLVGLDGASYYKSRELLRATEPGASYGQYVKNNLSLWEGETTLRFFSLYHNRTLSPYPPLMLDRSPIQHFTLFLQRREAPPGRYLLEVEVEDAQSNKINKISGLTL
jgi:hypothetical protein